jgi:cytochrome bd-type quinol oxidase subunit 2
MLKQIIFLCTLVCSASYASSTDIGQVAGNIGQLSENAAGIIQKICLVVGIGLLTASVVTYKEHRNNPEEVGWGKIFLFLIVGLAFVALSFIRISG